jgi:hypothetical protein
MDDLRAR